MNPDKILFIFDFDGVIIDSVGALYSVYLGFLEESGVEGSRDEFNQLNGPKISEIVSILKKKYRLACDEETLLAIYDKKLSSAYQSAQPVGGVEAVLKSIRRRNIKIALASSSKRIEIESQLNRFGLTRYFEFVVTGDDVERAKPSPDLYHAVKKQYPGHDYYVVEDSENGVEAAKQAGMTTIFFNPGRTAGDSAAAHEIGSLCEVEQILTEIELNCFTIARPSEIVLAVGPPAPDMDSGKRKAIEAVWQAESRERNLFDGKIVCYRSHREAAGVLYIECFISQYKFFLARLRAPELQLDINPIGISGIIFDKEGNTLHAKRQNVTEYEGLFEFIPAGSIDPLKTDGGLIVFQETVMTEFEEETRISRRHIQKIDPFCFVFDKTHGVYDICSKIYVDEPIRQLLNSDQNNEYRDVAVVHLDDIRDRMGAGRYVPTSVVMLNNIEKTGP